MEMMMQTVKQHASFSDGDEFYSAAVIYRDTLYYGNVHPVLLDEISNDHRGFVQADCVEGFVTKQGRFLTREEAKVVADKLGIVRPGRDKTMDPKLWSEYLPCWVLTHPMDGGKEICKRAWHT